MKYIATIIILLTIVGIFVGWGYLNLKKVQSEVINNPIQGVLTPTPAQEFSFKRINRKYSFVNHIKENQIKLIANYGNKKDSQTLMKENNCEFGMNGGFYDENFKALGLLITDSTVVSKQKTSQLFNGFVSLKCFNNTDKCAMEIGSDFDASAQTVLQSGPILISDGKSRELSMAQDKLARRMVLAKNALGEIIILTIYDPETEKMGSELGDVPELIVQISNKENLGITDAINMDGGRASAFYGTDKTLTESDSVGSWWCVSK